MWRITTKFAFSHGLLKSRKIFFYSPCYHSIRSLETRNNSSYCQSIINCAPWLDYSTYICYGQCLGLTVIRDNTKIYIPLLFSSPYTIDLIIYLQWYRVRSFRHGLLGKASTVHLYTYCMLEGSASVKWSKIA